MGIKCSLLGHAYAEADVERERTEQGDEVVTVVREVERCTRCGTERVVSENTEVTTVVEPDEVETGTEPAAGDAEPVEADSEDAPDEAVSSVVERADAGGDDGTTAAGGFESPDDPAEEDAEILEGGSEQEREPGQWPEEDAPFDPEGLAEEPAEAPESAVDPVEEPSDEAEVDATTDDASGEPRASLGGVGGADADYVCPECGFATDAATSSLREGDACPDCGVGWLQVERNR